MPNSPDGGFAFRIEFYRKNEPICELHWPDHLHLDQSNYRLGLLDGESIQWYIWHDPKLMQNYVAKVAPDFAAAFWK